MNRLDEYWGGSHKAGSGIALSLSFAARHRAIILPVVEKAVGMRHTATSPIQTAQKKPIAFGPGVERGHQRKAGAGNGHTRPAWSSGRLRGRCAPTVTGKPMPPVHDQAARPTADRVTPTVGSHASMRRRSIINIRRQPMITQTVRIGDLYAVASREVQQLKKRPWRAAPNGY